jgi:hypothetical protein
MDENGLAARVERALRHPPLSEMDARQRGELKAALAEAPAFEDLPGKWQAALLESESHGKANPLGHGQGRTLACLSRAAGGTLPRAVRRLPPR